MNAVATDTAGRLVAPEPLVRAAALSKAYGPITVLSDVTLDIRAGEVHAIIG